MQKSAIIIGATGLTGSEVLKQLLKDENYSSVKLFTRRSLGENNVKIEEFVGDLFNIESFRKDFVADEVYICIGTTKKKTPDRAEYRKIDIGIPVSAAKLARENGIQRFVVISAIGADAKSKIPYNKIKGEMEVGVQSVGIPRTYIIRPSLILGKRNEYRVGEKLGVFIFKLLNPLFVGKLKKYRGVEASAIAGKMIELCNSDIPSVVIESDEITLPIEELTLK